MSIEQDFRAFSVTRFLLYQSNLTLDIDKNFKKNNAHEREKTPYSHEGHRR
jgi:hypothetical protein